MRSFARVRIRNVVCLLFGIVTIVLFQNCAGGFQTRRFSSADVLAANVEIPVIAFATPPPSLINSKSLQIPLEVVFGQQVSASSITCQLDQSPAVDCSSRTWSLTNLSDGDHVLTLRAEDSRGQKAVEVMANVRVDTTEPALTISQQPPSVSGSNSATVVFLASDSLSGVDKTECSMDSAAFSNCTSPLQFTSLTAGAHSLQIRTFDKAGNPSALKTVSWTVDLSKPSVTISSRPENYSNSKTASFVFTGMSTGSAITGYQCKMDSGSYSTCSSPHTVNNLSEGAHTFSVQALTQTGMSSPLSVMWIVDTVVPTTPAIVANVGAYTKTQTIALSFSSTDTGSNVASYQCSQDGAAFATCTSPLNLANVTEGAHSLRVRSTDNATNPSAIAQFNWTVDLTLPVMQMTSGPDSITLGTTVTFEFTASDVLSGLDRVTCQLDSQASATCTSPKVYDSLAVGNHTVTVVAYDKAGNNKAIQYSWTMMPPELPNPIQQAKFQCTEPSASGSSQTHMLRLSKAELVNTISDIYGSAAVANLTSLALFPDDLIRDSVNEFTNAHAATQIEAIFNTGLAVAQNLTANRAMLNAVAPACVGQGLDAGSINDTCINQFIASLGPKMHRRPLSTAQTTNYLNLYKTNDASASGFTAKDRLEILIAAFFQAPEFIFHWNGTSGAADLTNQRIAVDAYTVANRIAYQVTGFPPDQTLYNAAAQGQLSTLQQVQAQAARLIDTARGHTKVRNLFHHWLRLYKTYPPNANVLSRMGIASDLNTQNRMMDEMVKETLDFAEYIVFTQNGTFADLFLSNLAFPQSADMAKILGLPTTARGATAVTDSRAGLTMRPAFLGGTGSERESPINRGIRIRMRVLCEPVPPPPANADDVAAEVLNGLDRTMHSTREIASLVTGSTTCISCHSFLNPPGYALGSFGALGEFRTVERVFDENGVFKSQFPINSEVTSGLNIVSTGDRAANHTELTQLLAQSTKAQGCFAQYAFRTTRMRFENAQDNCNLANVESQLTQNKPVKSALINSVASEDIFWKGLPK